LDEANNCGVVCKLQELDGGVFGGAVICVEGEKQWGENVPLGETSADGNALFTLHDFKMSG